MRLDNIPHYRSLWYEDEEGNELGFDVRAGFPDFKAHKEDVYQCSNFLVVTDSVHLCNNIRNAKWPVRALSWVIKKMPDAWKARRSQVLKGEATIGLSFPIIKYLVEEKDWRFSDAAVASSQLCERCLNIALWEVEGTDIATEQQYLDSVHTHCMYCKHIDIDYHNAYVAKSCYRAFSRGKSVKKEYDNLNRERTYEY